MLSSYYSGGVPNLDQTSLQDFQMVLESADSSVAGAVYSDVLSKINFSVSNTSLPTNVTFPSELFPLDAGDAFNLTYLSNSNGYMRGPISFNGSFYLSFTRVLTKNNPEFENTNQTFYENTIGYLTIISQASSLESITKYLNLEDGSRMVLISLSENYTRRDAARMNSLNYTFVFPSAVCSTCYGLNYSLKRDTPSYSALVDGMWGSVLSLDLNGYGKAAIGYAPVYSISKVWGVLVFQAHSVMYAPIRTLRDILIASVFSIGFGVCFATFLLSGWVVKPITRLQAATEQSTNYSGHKQEDGRFWRFWNSFKKSGHSSELEISKPLSTSGSEFRIPEKVVTRKYIKDELTELTETFNEMTSELRKQYAVLEERVIQRTKEIKTAKVLAETANEAKSLFIANITHELRTPLNGILGMAAVSMEESDPKNIRESLKVIFKSGELLLRLLTDLLSFSKSQVDNMKLEPKGFMIAEITSQLHAIFDEQSKASHIKFSINTLSPCLDKMELMGDINRILQVVMNLVSNSLKFTPADGTVTVSILATGMNNENLDSSGVILDSEKTVASLIIPNELKSIQLHIYVQDTGPGIAPHLQSRVFEPFVQGDLALSEKRGGVGLGLSICRQLAILMHGEVSLDSELGFGSKFSFHAPLQVICIQKPVQPLVEESVTIPSEIEFPVEDIKLKPSISHSSTPVKSKIVPKSNTKKPSYGNLSVLIAEDNIVNQEVLVRMLKLEGLTNVQVANDGLEAVSAVRESLKSGTQFDIIFMDIQMPNLDGKQATEVIRNELAYSGTIIAVSALTDNTNIDDCLAVGMNHFLAKPLRRPQLRSLLTEHQT